MAAAALSFQLGTSVTLEENYIQRLQELLPTGNNCNYLVSSFQRGDAEDHMSLTLRLQINTKEELMEWKEKFQEKSYATYRVAITYPGTKIKGCRVSFKERYYCQHGSRGKGQHSSKKTACKSTLGLTLHTVREKSRSKDPYLISHPSTILLNWCHDHPTYAASVLKYRDVAPSTREKFFSLFSNGHNPTSALKKYTAALQLELDDEFEFARSLADRRIVPDLKYLNRLYYSEMRSIFFLATGSNTKVELFDDVHSQSTHGASASLDNSPSPSTSAGLSDHISTTTSSEPSDHISPPASSEPSGDIFQASVESYHDMSASTESDAKSSPSTASSSASLHRIFQELQQKLLDDPETFEPVIDAFIKNYDNIGSDSGLIFALFAFGKYSGPSHKGKIVGGKRIATQRTAIARRKRKAFGTSIS